MKQLESGEPAIWGLSIPELLFADRSKLLQNRKKRRISSRFLRLSGRDIIVISAKCEHALLFRGGLKGQ